MRPGDTLLFVSKDMGGANVGIPLVKLAKESGYKVTVIAEGLAAEKYEDAGFCLYFKGTTNFSDEPFSIDFKRIVEKLKPAAVITTLGVPINLEQDFGLAANQFGIPLVFLEDFWGVHIRSEATPNLVLSIDEKAAELAREKYGSLARITVVGNHAVSRAQELVIPDDLRDKIEELRRKYGRVFVFTAGGTHVSGQIRLLIECLERTDDWVLVPRFHPKSVNLLSPSGRTFGEEWCELLEKASKRVVYVDSKTTDPLAALADATLSDFSTLLTTALVFGHLAISVVTPQVRQTMENEIGFTSHPLVSTGLVIEVAEPCDLSRHLTRELPVQYLQPYDSQRALQEIEGL